MGRNCEIGVPLSELLPGQQRMIRLLGDQDQCFARAMNNSGCSPLETTVRHKFDGGRVITVSDDQRFGVRAKIGRSRFFRVNMEL